MDGKNNSCASTRNRKGEGIGHEVSSVIFVHLAPASERMGDWVLGG